MTSLFNKKNFSDLSVLIGSACLYFIAVYFYSPGNWALLETSPHPFFLISIIYSAYYGFRHSLFSSLFFSVLYLALVSYQVDFQEVESLFLMKFLKLPILITFVSLVLGEVRQRTFARNKDNIRKLETTSGVNRELKGKLDLASIELKELQKRYATLTESFAGNVKLIEELDNKSFEEIIELSSTYLQEECKIGRVSFYGNDATDVPTEEKKVLAKLQNHLGLYTIKEDLQKPEEQKVLTHVNAEIVAPLKASQGVIGYYFLEDIPFLSMNVFNQKRIVNVLRIVEVAIGNTSRIQNWQENSAILYPFDIYKKQPFFKELERFYSNMGHLLDGNDHYLIYVDMDLKFDSSLKANQKEKILLLVSHLAKNDRKGIVFTGGDLNHGHLYIAFVSTEKVVNAEVKQLIVETKSLMPNELKKSFVPSFIINKFDDAVKETLVYTS